MSREQFIALVAKEQSALRRFLLALCGGNRPDAEDIAQETLIKAYLSIGQYREQQKFSAWLSRIAYHTFLDHRRNAREADALPETAAIAGTERADDAYKYQELYQALNALPEKERVAILLFYIQGYSVREISQIVGSSEEAVKKQLSRGREHLKQIIK